jgi:hypothetical protein
MLSHKREVSLTLVEARDVRTNTPNPGTGILFGSVGKEGMLSIASEKGIELEGGGSVRPRRY